MNKVTITSVNNEGRTPILVDSCINLPLADIITTATIITSDKEQLINKKV